MIVGTNLRILVTFQALALTFAKDPLTIYVANAAGTEIEARNAAYPNLVLVLSGTNLEVTEDGQALGALEKFDFELEGSDARLSVLLPAIFLIQDLIAAAGAGSGVFIPSNYLSFYTLLLPLWSFLNFVGSVYADIIQGFATDDFLSGKGGNDTLIISDGDDEFNGGGGKHDKIDGSQMDTAMTANLSKNTVTHAGGVTKVKKVEDVDGTGQNDTIIGNKGDNILRGLGGDDVIEGKGGNDTLRGGDGDDVGKGGDGADTVHGDKGQDNVFGGKGNDRVYGDGGNDSVYGDGGNDRVWGGDGTDLVRGGAGNDRVFGGKGNDHVYGDKGKDKVYGDGGADHVYGGKGNDSVFGGKGDDHVYGNEGNDTLSGGPGHDTFVFNSGYSESDSITDFNKDDDTLELWGTNAAGVTVTSGGGNTTVSYKDSSGGDHSITLEGVSLTEAEIVFDFIG